MCSITDIALSTDAGKQGQSGEISLITGDATDEDAGRIKLLSGPSANGRGGEIALLGGKSKTRIRRTVDGSDVILRAGDTEARSSSGGSVRMSGGSGLNNERVDGGNGGSVEILGGRAHGLNKKKDFGEDPHLCHFRM